jgi:hypothetical protein
LATFYGIINNEVGMKKILFLSLVLMGISACGLPQETRRGVGNEGLLIIQAIPDDAEIYADGQMVGKAEEFAKNPLELKSGTHKIEIRKAGFATEAREIFVGNQSRHTLKVNLRKSP